MLEYRELRVTSNALAGTCVLGGKECLLCDRRCVSKQHFDRFRLYSGMSFTSYGLVYKGPHLSEERRLTRSSRRIAVSSPSGDLFHGELWLANQPFNLLLQEIPALGSGSRE